VIIEELFKKRDKLTKSSKKGVKERLLKT